MKFCVRIVFKVDAAVTARQNLVVSAALPIALYLVPGSGGSDVHLLGPVTTATYGAGRASTEFLLDGASRLKRRSSSVSLRTHPVYRRGGDRSAGA